MRRSRVDLLCKHDVFKIFLLYNFSLIHGLQKKLYLQAHDNIELFLITSMVQKYIK